MFLCLEYFNDFLYCRLQNNLLCYGLEHYTLLTNCIMVLFIALDGGIRSPEIIGMAPPRLSRNEY